MSQIAEVIQAPLFAREKKKLNKTQRKKLDEAVKTIMTDPAVGRAKSGDLQGVRIYKYKLGNKQILLAYEVVDSTLYLYTFGSHENFYRNLSKYIHQ
ncbi:mRNA-degrading endonuclease RelE, toxin component of the RelBE toxin-antitoxin system [Candidatus Electrothrix aarhusensis]|uniref:mRNA-degrading endonuclease RelE, toxin component of the RelBE toxin-antitoxin system n=1 Tax=Candidatus Electrothrix aarhusensis TaxID=1859131 RepID=A0A3S3R6K3_9BACT|nr:mRNA-degrading endonuclease RelE, toxin component of the RelBE toxin-antitoxin system [Candidatus Electrothrix aarhusensis]